MDTDDRVGATARLADELGGLTPEWLLNSPFVLISTPAQMAEQIRDRRQRFGASYWTVFDELPGRPSAMHVVAQVIALLR